MPTAMRDVRSREQSGKHILAVSLSGFDPRRTSERPREYLEPTLTDTHTYVPGGRLAMRRREFSAITRNDDILVPKSRLRLKVRMLQ
jgi:hypothetical protein